ncbi:hypothetical protein FOS14_21085 [Skermania sp. ID1734]|uniref:hypothetical protein n=1 Tax=Skermania sp. ID1734 TaxID=2597516 RepID=UPI00117C5B8F|nr:hypothetical protein [Skermania sp. ID1734]TSD94253.1 hypothetical protein FOS14_21085 [Skermania sp. ID1734]
MRKDLRSADSPADARDDELSPWRAEPRLRSMWWELAVTFQVIAVAGWRKSNPRQAWRWF